MTARKLLGVLSGVLLALGALSVPAYAAEQSTATTDVSVQGTWMCSVPAGMTYTRVQYNLNQCNPGGWANSYYVETPADYLWACTIPSGFTYTRAQNNLNQCNSGGWANSYYLQTPSVGLWACTVPPGFSYSQVQNNLNQCNPGGWAYSYRLA